MNEFDIRQRDIDSGASALVSALPAYTPTQWRVFAQRNFGDTRSIYARCATLAEAAREINAL